MSKKPFSYVNPGGWLPCRREPRTLVTARTCLRLTVICGISLIVVGVVAAFVVNPILGIGALLLTGYGGKRTFQSTTFGSARLGELNDVLLAGRGEKGLLVGTLPPLTLAQACRWLMWGNLPAEVSVRLWLDAVRKKPSLVWIPRGVHTLVVAPSGAGKNVSFIFPFLLTCPDSAVVIDPKGENFLRTHLARQKMGQKCVLLDPFGVVKGHNSDTFDPLAGLVEGSNRLFDDIQALAQAIIQSEPRATDPHWVESAISFVAGIIAYVVLCEPEEYRNFQTVITILADPAKLSAALEKMKASHYPELVRLGSQLDHYQEKERSSVLTTVARNFRSFASSAVVANTRSSSFDFDELRTGKMTAYCVLPPEYLRSHANILRVWLNCGLRSVIRGGANEHNLVHLILDEAAALGNFPIVTDALAQLRGYGLRIQLYYQSLGQLKSCFPEGGDQTVINNCNTILAFGTNDADSANTLSTMIGDATIANVSISGGDTKTTNRDQHGCESRSTSSASNWNVAMTARRVLKPEEILQLDQREVIVFTKGIPPLLVHSVRFWDADFKRATPGRMTRLWMLAKATAYMVVSVGFTLTALVLVMKK